MASGPETKLVDRMRTAILRRWPSAWIVKVHGGPYQTSGIPDLLVAVEGRLVGLEVKARGVSETPEHAKARATELQLATLARIRRAGAVAGVVITVEEAVELVASALEVSDVSGTLT